jgi:uncharacterized protein (DUF433 family)
MMTLETVQTVPLTMTEDGTIRLTGSRVLLDLIVHHHQQGESPEDIHEAFPSLKLADIYAVISYYLNHRAEVEEYLRQQESRAAEVRRLIEASPFHKDTTGLRERLQARRDATQRARNNDQP